MIAAGLAFASLLVTPMSASAQQVGLGPSDSALVFRILLAEDSRDSTAAALDVGRKHADPRIRRLAMRAYDRITDSTFATRSKYDSLPAPPHWPDPEWLGRFRHVPVRGASCDAIATALHDTAWQVRFRAAAVAPQECGDDREVAGTLSDWIDDSNNPVDHRIATHAAARALVALSRLKVAGINDVVRRFSRSGTALSRHAAAESAAGTGQVELLRKLARDADPNVREAAITALSGATGHRDDSLYVAALGSDHAQVVRSAALALVNTPDHDAIAAANAAFENWVGRDNASARDVRLALLRVAGRPVSDDIPPHDSHRIPHSAVALALGADTRLRVTMAPSSGGGSFVVKLRGDVAPITAARILELARDHYYDGLTWHRVEPGFVIQGGSPGANEYVGSDRYFRDELGTVPHRRGTVGMSTRGHDTGDAQWFVNLADNLRLDRNYTVFGEVVEGMDVVDEIMPGDVIAKIEDKNAEGRPSGRPDL